MELPNNLPAIRSQADAALHRYEENKGQAFSLEAIVSLLQTEEDLTKCMDALIMRGNDLKTSDFNLKQRISEVDEEARQTLEDLHQEQRDLFRKAMKAFHKRRSSRRKQDQDSLNQESSRSTSTTTKVPDSVSVSDKPNGELINHEDDPNDVLKELKLQMQELKQELETVKKYPSHDESKENVKKDENVKRFLG